MRNKSNAFAAEIMLALAKFKNICYNEISVNAERGIFVRALILSVKAGYGHHSTAKAIIEKFEKNGHECVMLDIFDYINKHLGNSIQEGYLLSTKYLSAPYGKVYGKLNKKDEPYDKYSALVMASHMIAKKLEGYCLDFAPDVIIGTHSFACMVMTELAEFGVIDCPTMGIVTDFTIHPFWESTLLDYYIVPDRMLIYEMMRKGIPEDKILPIGIPIREQFETKTDKSEARKKLGISDRKTILVMSGSMGYGNIKKTLIEMDDFPGDFQILCVCGSNKKIKTAIERHSWKKEIYIYGFVGNINEMMDASDFIISKPGGLTTSEAFAKGLPMITVNPLPGQEDRNMDFLVNSGCVIMVNKRYTISEALYQLLSCPWRCELMEESVRHVGKPNAAEDLYQFVLKKLSANSAETEKLEPAR